jgi:hypothetical protein
MLFHDFMINNTRQIDGRNLSQSDKRNHEKPTVNIILNSEKLKVLVFPCHEKYLRETM